MPRGTGSATTRRIRIDGIYQRQGPIPNARGDETVVEFMKEMKDMIETALIDFEKQTHTAGVTGLQAIETGA